MKGRRIKTLQQLAKAAIERKSVIPCERHFPYCKPKPAEFVMHNQAAWVARFLDLGLYIYHPERKKKSPAVRNPESIDFNLYPIPEGYTVASERDCAVSSAPVDWMIYSGGEWHLLREEIRLRNHWTYLRPLRKGEKGVRV